ncbi:MAG: FecR domain-containing protein [bacterium]
MAEGYELAEDPELTKVFRLIGSRPKLPESTKQIWAKKFRDELEDVINQRRRRRYQLASCFTVVLVVIALGGVVLKNKPALEPAWATINHLDGNIAINGQPLRSTATNAHRALNSGDRLTINEDSFAQIEYVGADMRLRENTIVQLYPDKVFLISGQIYISSHTAPDSPMVIRAGSTEIRDIGTQFMVSFANNRMTTQVRDGMVSVSEGENRHLLDAAESARKYQRTENGEISISDVAGFGESWDWILSARPSYAIKGKSASAFLDWYADETGREIIYSDKQARLTASEVTLYGNFEGIDTDQLLDITLATTTLEYAITPTGRIRISSRENPTTR